jgi:hypothetical protein
VGRSGSTRLYHWKWGPSSVLGHLVAWTRVDLLVQVSGTGTKVGGASHIMHSGNWHRTLVTPQEAQRDGEIDWDSVNGSAHWTALYASLPVDGLKVGALDEIDGKGTPYPVPGHQRHQKSVCSSRDEANLEARRGDMIDWRAKTSTYSQHQKCEMRGHQSPRSSPPTSPSRCDCL